MTKKAIASIGQVVTHKVLNYRGVVYDVDPVFMLSDNCYKAVAKNRPPKNEPWYRILVHNSSKETYVAQRNLIVDDSGAPIEHPQVDRYFLSFLEGRYIPARFNN